MARNRSFSDDASADAGEAVQAPDQDSGAAPPLTEDPSGAPAPSLATDGAPPPKHPFTVADGRAIACLKGTIAAGEPIRAMDLAGGEATLAELVKSGDVDDHRPKA